MATYTTHYNLKKPASGDYVNVADLNGNADIIDTELYDKVDKETGKGLSTNDYTTEEKTKLAGIESGAQVNPSAASANPLMDGTASAGSSSDYARGDHVHPSDTTKVDKETGKGLSANDYTDEDKAKLTELSQYVAAGIIFDTASGSMASFPDGGDGLPVKSAVVNVDPVQDLHGYDKPWTGGAGKNLAENLAAVMKTVDGVTYTPQADGSIKCVGTITGQNRYDLNSQPIRLAPGNYKLDAGADSTVRGIRFVLKIINSNTSSARYIDIYTENGTSTTIAEGEYIELAYLRGNYTNEPVNATIYPMIRLSSTSPEYEPYSNICPITGHTSAAITREGVDSSQTQTYNITFPTAAGTVYGGTLDLNAGVLTVDKAYYKPTTFVTNSINEYSVSVIAVAPNAIAGNLTIISNMMTAGYRNQTSVQSKKLVCYRGGASSHTEIAIAGDITLYSTYDALKTALADVEFVYDLENPVQYELTPQEITTLLGINHIWADTGNVSVEYAADPKLYINKVIANTLNA